MRRIDVTVSGLWRTPNSQLIKAKSSVVKLDARTPADPQVGLADQVMASLLHTPTSKANPGSPSMAERDAGSWFLTKDNLLTTPCADDTGLRTERYQQGGTPLSMQVAAMEGMLPTPRAIYGEHPGMTDPKHLTGAALLPTPRHEGHDALPHRGQPDSLHSYAKMHPTPCERDFRTGMADRSWNPKRTQNLPERTAADLGMVSAKLNPDWVQRMQGFPDGWLDI